MTGARRSDDEQLFGQAAQGVHTPYGVRGLVMPLTSVAAIIMQLTSVINHCRHSRTKSARGGSGSCRVADAWRVARFVYLSRMSTSGEKLRRYSVDQDNLMHGQLPNAILFACLEPLLPRDSLIPRTVLLFTCFICRQCRLDRLDAPPPGAPRSSIRTTQTTSPTPRRRLPRTAKMTSHPRRRKAPDAPPPVVGKRHRRLP